MAGHSRLLASSYCSVFGFNAQLADDSPKKKLLELLNCISC